jgi:hypothetical protein
MVTVTLTISDELYERLQERSARENRSLEEILLTAAESVAARAEPDDSRVMTRDEERRRLREALGDIIMEFDADAFLKAIGIEPMPPDELAKAMQNLPVLDPPASRTLIQMRDEERY